MQKLIPKRGDYAVVHYSGSEKLHVATLTKTVEHKHRDDLWDGNILCDARPRYYFVVGRDNVVDRCPQCFRRWKTAGSPALLGHTPTDLPATGDIELHWGWREVTPIGFPNDGNPSDDADPKVKELRRFQRGKRIIRIAEILPDQHQRFLRFSIQFGKIDKLNRDTRYDADFKEQLKRAREWMCWGGSPRN